MIAHVGTGLMGAAFARAARERGEDVRAKAFAEPIAAGYGAEDVGVVAAG